MIKVLASDFAFSFLCFVISIFLISFIPFMTVVLPSLLLYFEYYTLLYYYFVSYGFLFMYTIFVLVDIKRSLDFAQINLED